MRIGLGLHPDLAHMAEGELQQWRVIAAPGHPFLRAVIKSDLSNIDPCLAQVERCWPNRLVPADPANHLRTCDQQLLDRDTC